MPHEYRRVGGWPVTPRMQMWAAVVAAIPVAAVVIAHGTVPWLIGTILAVLAVWPHEHLHAIGARVFGVNARVHWKGLNPHTRLLGQIGMAGVAVTSLAPQVMTAWFLALATVFGSEAFALAALLHALISTGDYLNAAYAIVSLIRPRTRGQVLLDGAGEESGLYRAA